MGRTAASLAWCGGRWLFSELIGGICRAKLAEWTPDRHGYDRAAAIDAIPGWDARLKSASVPALLRCLRSENENVWRRAAQVLPIVAERSAEIKQKLLRSPKTLPRSRPPRPPSFPLGLDGP